MLDPETPESFLALTVTGWDEDSIDIELCVRFAEWSGAERVEASRQTLPKFADALDRVAAGAIEATLEIGHPTYGYGACRVFEYGGARRLGVEVTLSHAGGLCSNRPDSPRELRVSIPIERGQLMAFAASLRTIAAGKRGTARLPVLRGWP